MTASRSPSDPGSDLARFTRDPFAGFFEGRSAEELVEERTLLDTPAVRRWFDLLHRGLPDSLYTYQIPLSRAAGPESAALDRDLLMFSSYSYLGLIGDRRIAAEVTDAVERYGTSTGGVRLLTGTLELHHRLEAELAAFLGVEGAAVFSSGYDANVAAITALFGPGDWAILDQYAHQSIQDGCRMAGVEVRPFRHNDMADLERRLRQAKNRGKERVLIAVDGVFSMDGDQAPLAEIIRLKEQYGAFLLVDEAHALAAIGETGRGTCEAQGVDPARIDILTGSLSKGIPSSGGFVAGSAALKIYMQHGSGPYIFSAALTPANTAAALAALRLLGEDGTIMDRLRENARRLRAGVEARGLDTGACASPVVPLILGDEWRAYRWARRMLDDGIFVSAVVYPAVAPGIARLRLCATAAHRPEHFDRLFAAIDDCLADIG
ncbi:MAG: aminotransferase class I/II-fold pyridoxal phosphate-dependent enzyme [Gemmatimonadetes bacterium]|nr:aminotransferase class I/II-fold pyridoxal phosphate-dependent enzyme [Gemmatimonadota bacterium]